MRIRERVLVSLAAMLLITSAAGQERSRAVNVSLSGSTAAAQLTGPTYIPPGSKVYVADIDGLIH